MTVATLESILELHQAGQMTEAEEGYLDILAEDPSNSEVLKLLGVLSCQKNEYEEGINYLEAAVDLDDSVAEYHFALAHAYLAFGEVEKGVDATLKAAEIDPGRADIFGHLGDTYQKISNFSGALTAYQRATVIDPDNHRYKVCAGLCAVFTGQHDSATEYLEQALESGEEVSQAHYGLALIFAEAGDNTAAVSSMAKALALDPGNSEYQRLYDQYQAG